MEALLGNQGLNGWRRHPLCLHGSSNSAFDEADVDNVHPLVFHLPAGCWPLLERISLCFVRASFLSFLFGNLLVILFLVYKVTLKLDSKPCIFDNYIIHHT